MRITIDKSSFSKGFFLIISLLCLSFLRPALVLFYPIIFLVFCQFYGFRLTTNYFTTFSLIFLVSLISMFLEGWFLMNYVVGTYLILSPIILLSLSLKSVRRKSFQNQFDSFFKIFVIILSFVNISAIIYAIVALWSTSYPDDVFTGLYGKSGFGSHTLSILNTAVSVYFLFRKQYKKFLFFVVCGILGFYGLGLLIFLLAGLIFYIPLIIKNISLVLKGFLVLLALSYVMYLVNPGNIDYIKVNIRDTMSVFNSYDYDKEMKKINNYERTFVPRYLTFFYGTGKLFFSNPKVLLLGTSPGTYNSRTAFYLNGDFLQNQFIKNHFSENTKYHEEYVKPLLNRKLISVPWNDGTRNQPFSSLIGLLLEYGFLLGLLIMFIVGKKFNCIIKKTPSQHKKNYLIFLSVFLGLLLLVQNYLEYPEIIVFFIMIFKLIELDNSYENSFK